MKIDISKVFAEGTPVNEVLKVVIGELEELDAFVLSVRTSNGEETTYGFGAPSDLVDLLTDAAEQIRRAIGEAGSLKN